jgi:cell division protein FtsB
MRILGDFEGSGKDFSRILSFLRERDAEVELLKTRLIDTEKRVVSHDFSGVDAERTIASLKAENSSLTRQIDQLRSSSSATGTSSSDSRVR